jgi:hypothetical protein
VRPQQQRYLWIGLAALVGLATSACRSESVTAVDPSTVVITPQEETLFADQTVAQNWRAAPLYGTAQLSAGFTPDPHSVHVTAGVLHPQRFLALRRGNAKCAKNQCNERAD